MNTIIAGFIGPQEIIVILLSIGFIFFILLAVFIIFRSINRSKNKRDSLDYYKHQNQ